MKLFDPYFKDCDGKLTKHTEHRFLVAHYFNNSDISMEMKSLIGDRDLQYLPWISVAVPMDSSASDVDDRFHGHEFCFLPLPLEERKASRTGLPAHISGFFAVSQDRHHLN